MAGKKGRSGRGTNFDEAIQRRVLSQCWDLVEKNLNNPALDLEFRIDLASKHTAKAIPTELSGGFAVNSQTMPTIQRVSGEAQPMNMVFNIGSPPTPEDTRSTA